MLYYGSRRFKIEKKNSNYAYVHFLKGVDETDHTIDGRMVQLNYPLLESKVDLVTVSEYERLQRDFPDRIKGAVIEQDNLMNVANLFFEKLKEDIQELPQVGEETNFRYGYLRDQFVFDNVLKPSRNTDRSVDDLVNKFMMLQQCVRDDQRRCSKKK